MIRTTKIILYKIGFFPIFCVANSTFAILKLVEDKQIDLVVQTSLEVWKDFFCGTEWLSEALGRRI